MVGERGREKEIEIEEERGGERDGDGKRVIRERGGMEGAREWER